MWTTRKSAYGIVLGLFTAWAVYAPAAAHPLTVLYDLCSTKGCKSGTEARGLSADQVGNLYGVTNSGPHSLGSVYELKRGHALKVLHQFCLHRDCSDGAQPFAAPIIDVNGTIYGTTESGGGNGGGVGGRGVVYMLSPDGAYRRLYAFCSQINCVDGALARGRLTYAGAQTGAPYDGVSPGSRRPAAAAVPAWPMN